MDKAMGKLTVFLEGPFWVGVFERVEDGRLSVSKHTFGAEPKDGEVWEFVTHRYQTLSFSPSVEAEGKKETQNPKRAQRNARKELLSTGIGTRSQQALQLQREARKEEAGTVRKERRKAEEAHRYECRKQKRKEKHRGR